jgi:hypothetical protein
MLLGMTTKQPLPGTVSFERWEQRQAERAANPAWFDAPKPRRWHRCKPHTAAATRLGFVQRCACGAARFDDCPWIERNSSR